jgi:cytochrome P450
MPALNGEEWLKYQALVKKSLRLIPHSQDEVIKRILSTAKQLYIEPNLGKKVDVDDLCNRIALDVMGEYLLGIKVGSLDGQLGEQVFKDLLTISDSLGLVTLLKPQSMLDTEFEAIKRINEYISGLYDSIIVDSVLEQEKDEVEDCRVAPYLKRAEKRGEISHDDAVDLLTFLFFAGHMTTASSMTALLYEVAKSNTVQSRVRQGIAMSDDSYLGACVKENLRLNPPAMAVQTRIAGEKSILPTGLLIKTLIPALHLSGKHWKDPLQFCPSRFLDEDAQYKGDNKHAFMPFGHGPRQCPGSTFAKSQIACVVKSILQDYIVSLPEDSSHSGYLHMSFGIAPRANGLQLVFVPLPETGVHNSNEARTDSD